ncbi:ABC transporter substrate-binding protein [uncultured Acetatifactor sp.]|uniref:ABC transporter substrate-binding protein n=1 Tax=uncultured Acetatifactor sp. TaxID=1671927 RepID=UPI002614547F|nr:ABC transporter substrate-binding protein [uncultured Acetatifactor sp.]
MKKVNKALALVLAAAMMTVTACGNGESGGSSDAASTPLDSESESSSEVSASESEPSDSGATEIVVDNTPAAEVNTLENFDAANYGPESDEVYDLILGDFYALYQEALAEVDPSARMGKMAVAEAKFLEAGLGVPMQNNTGGSGISKVIPRSVPTVTWGFDQTYRGYKNLLVVNERPLTPDERAEATSLWSSKVGTGEAWQALVDWATEKELTLNDNITLTYSTTPQTWDMLGTAQAASGEVISPTWDGLLTYDNENIQQPGLAESYEVSEDGLTYTFHIRKGVKWVTSQGTEVGEVKADDWVAGLQHACDTKAGLADLIYGTVKNLQQYGTGEISDFSQVGVKALDDYTLEYTLETNAPWFLTLTGYSALAPLSRDYYTSQGGKFGAEFDSADSGYLYGTDPEHIAYCGPYLISNYTYQNTISYAANPAYWDAENVHNKTITRRYADGTDPLFGWNNFLDGTFYSVTVSSAVRPLAEQQASEIDPEKNYVEAYSYSSHESTTAIMNWTNVNRYAHSNLYNDASAMVSKKTVTDAQRTKAAMRNQNFRMALALSYDRFAYMSVIYGEENAYGQMTNSYVPGNFVTATKEFTVDIAGTATTFPAGTQYGEVLQAAITADGYPMKVWNPTGADGAGSSFSFDGWYNPEAAGEYLAKAVEELAAEGIEISAENPIYLDMPYDDFDTTVSAAQNAVKQSYDAAFGGMVIVNLVAKGDSDTGSDAAYNPTAGYMMNYDLGGLTGWGPDYGDAQTYLDTVIPNGYECITWGIYGS